MLSSSFLATIIQSSCNTFTFQRRKLRLREVTPHVIYPVMEMTGFEGSKAHWTWVHVTVACSCSSGTMDSAREWTPDPGESRGLESKQRWETEAFSEQVDKGGQKGEAWGLPGYCTRVLVLKSPPLMVRASEIAVSGAQFPHESLCGH